MQKLDERPMPQADPVSVRLAANRAAAVASELQQLRTQLSGAAANDGWTGTARLAFDREIADRIRQFDPAIARYDGYAASLVSYARSLEQTLPTLRAARAKLDAVPAATLGKPDGSPLPSDPEVDFDRLWREWDDARRTCVSALEQAGRNGADRHGLSALWHSAGHVVHEITHVNLADISKVSDELGDVLFVAALVLSPVPGLGEALWAAVAVVSVAKFAVDSARMASGDRSVSKGDLAWDAIGAMPGGKAAKEAKEVVVLKTEVDGLATGAKEVRIVPGGGLMAHEAPNTKNGHTLLKHVAKPYDYLVGRFKNRAITRSSSFYDRATAEHVLAGVLSHADTKISAWLASPAQSLQIEARCKDYVGVTISRVDRVAVPTKKFLINLEKDPNLKLGYYIPTSHPAP